MREVRLRLAYYDIITCNVNEMPNILLYVSMHIHILGDNVTIHSRFACVRESDLRWIVIRASP